MRYVIYGAGGVGSSLALALTDAGCDVTIVARGEHGRRLASKGLIVRTPRSTRTATVTVVPSEALELSDTDVIFVAVKSQDSREVFDAIEALCPRVTVVTAQNGVENERWAEGRFAHLVGAMVWIPAVFLDPGTIAVHSSGPLGAIRLGAWETGHCTVAAEISAALARGGLDSAEVAEIGAWKRGKLLVNLAGAVDAFLVQGRGNHDLVARARAEGERVLDAAGLSFIEPGELTSDMNQRVPGEAVDGVRRPGGSTWQSAFLGKPSEVEFLNGTICRLGMTAGVETPVNAGLVELAREATAPRSVDLDRFLARVEGAQT